MSFNWQQLGEDIDGEDSGDRSGFSVALSSDGTTVAIGARRNDGYGYESGHVRVYKYLNNSGWTQLGQDIDGENDDDESGRSVALSADGTIVAIGAPYNDGNGSDSGHVRIYQWNNLNNEWVQLGQDIDGETEWDQSGWSVSLSDNGLTVAIGARYNDGNGSDSGHVRIYQWNNLNNEWVQLGQDIDGEAEWDESGSSVSLSGNGLTVAIGARTNSNENGAYSGHVRIYQWNNLNSLWTQLGQDINGEAEYNFSGNSVSLSADGLTVAIGAPDNLNNNGSNNGHVRIYKWNNLNSVWTQLGQDIDGEAEWDESGYSVSLSNDGTIVAIGAPSNSDGNGNYNGHVRIYQWNGTTWTQLGQDIDGEADNDEFGGSVSLSADGLTVAIGAHRNDGNGGNSGHVRIYTYGEVPVIPICFLAGTPVQTDQGSIDIEKINPSIHTIRGNKIVAITKTITIENSIVCIEKDALGLNIPSQKTYISRNHKLFFNKQMIKAKNLIGQVDGVYNKKYNGEILYNVLLNTHDKMIVNNLIVETLDPENIVAKLYNGTYNLKEKNNIIADINNCAKEYKKQFGKLR
jgi:hypothetical protein